MGFHESLAYGQTQANVSHTFAVGLELVERPGGIQFTRFRAPIRQQDILVAIYQGGQPGASYDFAWDDPLDRDRRE